jgi:uncharacterized protein
MPDFSGTGAHGQENPLSPVSAIMYLFSIYMTHVRRALFILYVRDQAASTAFYRAVLAAEPSLNVPGMTEFALTDSSTLGLMPQAGIVRLLGSNLPDPASAHGIPRAEVYVHVDHPQTFLDRALRAGATALSPCQPRNWGDTAGYCLDPDGHVLAFADKTTH